MKRFTIMVAVVAMVALLYGNAFAAKASSSSNKTEVDGMLSLASDPVSGFGTTLGLGAGIGFDLSDSLHPSTGRLFGRADINYYDWSGDFWWTGLSYTRIPIFVGGRYYVPASGSNVDVFVEAGLELSFDHYDTAWFPGWKYSKSELNIGITPGAGIEIPISSDGLFIGGDARWHLITDDYFTLSLVLGKKF
jgi:hypothetical protein